MNRNDLHELMLLYVIDGLDPAERDAVQRLLDAGDPDAEHAYAQAAQTLASLPEVLEPAEPDPAVLDQLLSRAKGTTMPNDPAPPAPAETNERGTAPIAAVGIWPKLAIAAAFVLGIGLTAVVMVQVMRPADSGRAISADDWADIENVIAQQKQALAGQERELSRLQTQLAQLQDAERIDSLKRVIEDQRVAINEQRQRIGELSESMELLVGPGVQQAELAGGVEVPNAQGRLMWDPQTGQMRLLTRGLPALKPGETYQLWFVTEDEQTVSLGVFEVNEVAEATASYVASAPVVPNNVNVAAISIEPAGGSPKPGPTGPIIMTGPPKGE